MTTVKQIERIVKHKGKVVTIGSDATAAAAAKKMCENRVGCLVVVNGKSHLLGILTERDIIRHVVARSRNPLGTHVAEIMTKDVISCTLKTDIGKAQRIMAEHSIRHLPIVEDGTPVGMISSRDILAHQLSATRAIVVKQSRILQDLEQEHPGISQLKKGPHGRIILDEISAGTSPFG